MRVRGRRYAAVASAAAVAALSGLGSCFVGGFDLLPTATTTSAAGGSGGTGGGAVAGSGGVAGAGAGAGGGPCVPLHPPSPPASSDPGADSEDFVVALRSIDFAEEETEESGPPIGYDLDDVCTCLGDDFSCVEPDYATGDHCDGPGGRDNAFALLLLVARAFNPGAQSSAFTSALESGELGLLVRVWGYNGQPNDTQVSVAIYPSGGLDENACAPSGAPAWDGEDAWPVYGEAIVGAGGAPGSGGGGGCSAGQVPGASPDDARFVDHNAFVTDSLLVASPSELLLMLSGEPGPGQIALTGATLTARLEQSAPAERWQMREGVIVGRTELQNVWDAVGAVVNGGDPVCTDHPYYELVTDGVCRYPDIAAELSGPTASCDAFSFGMAFEAEPARLGVVYWPTATPAECAAGTEPPPLDCAQ